MISLYYGLVIWFGLLLLIGFFVCWIFNQNSMIVYWSSAYECGFSPVSFSFNFFSFSYFSLLVFFVVFDLEISLLLNMPEQGLLYNNFYYYYIFLFLLILGLLIEVFVGYIRWGY